MKSKNYILKITTAAVMMALTCVFTAAVRIPSPTKGYMNPGDCIVLLGGWMLGPVWGSVAGGVGSAFADLIAGYPVYIPATLIIKALMSLCVSVCLRFSKKRDKGFSRTGFLIGAVLAEILMTAGYYFYEAAVIGLGFVPAIAGVSGNAVQGVLGVFGGYFLVEILSRNDIINRVR